MSFELGFCDLQRIPYILYNFLTKEKACEKPQRREGSWSIQEIQRMLVGLKCGMCGGSGEYVHIIAQGAKKPEHTLRKVERNNVEAKNISKNF